MDELFDNKQQLLNEMYLKEDTRDNDYEYWLSTESDHRFIEVTATEH